MGCLPTFGSSLPFSLFDLHRFIQPLGLNFLIALLMGPGFTIISLVKENKDLGDQYVSAQWEKGRVVRF